MAVFTYTFKLKNRQQVTVLKLHVHVIRDP